LVWCKKYRYFKRAFKKEIAIKKLKRAEKERMVNEDKK
jgi:predicted GIY-YIG superfamily endonuclease